MTGAGGLLGTPLTALLRARMSERVCALPRAELDITDEPAVRRRVAELRPAIVINCAAFTRVDDCERESERALHVNGRGAGIVAAAARDAAARVVHISTDYVFDGAKPGAYIETDPTGPAERLSAYGRSKLAGEEAVRTAAGDAALIVRTSWVFGRDGPNFVATILNLARTRPELRVVNDQRGRPTYAPDLAGAIVELIACGATGVVHAASADPCTWFEFAGEIVARAGLATTVHSCTTAEFPRPARRPANSVLDTSRFESLTGRGLRSWRDGLTEMLAR